MTMSTDRRASVKLAALFIVLAGIPLVALGWLGGRLLAQDRALESQRRRDRLENAATLLTRELDRSLAAWDARLPSAAQGTAVELPPSGVVLVFDSRGVVQHQGVPLLFYPLVPPSPDVPGDLFAAGEVQEFQQDDLGSAAATYRGLAAAHDGSVRAAALARLARARRKQGRFAEALAVYAELAEMGETPVMGSPAALLARHERLAVFRMTGDAEAGAREAATLGAALWHGDMTIDRATFEFYRESVPAEPAIDRLALADAIDGLWPLWQQQASLGGGGKFRLDFFYNLRSRRASIAGLELDPVPSPGIVARRHHHGSGSALLPHGKGNSGRRCVTLRQPRGNASRRNFLRNSASETVAHKAAVIADHQAAARILMREHIPRHRTGHQADIIKGEIVCNNASPPVGSKTNGGRKLLGLCHDFFLEQTLLFLRATLPAGLSPTG